MNLYKFLSFDFFYDMYIVAQEFFEYTIWSVMIECIQDSLLMFLGHWIGFSLIAFGHIWWALNWSGHILSLYSFAHAHMHTHTKTL